VFGERLQAPAQRKHGPASEGLALRTRARSGGALRFFAGLGLDLDLPKVSARSAFREG
jgi:hypothetical protein